MPFNLLRGFYDFNMVNVAKLNQLAIESIDPVQKIIFVEKTAEFQRALSAAVEGDGTLHRFYNLYAVVAVPNYNKMVQAVGFDQTRADEAQIVCALERYRLARGNYPQTLNDLVPQFIGELPHDIISGQPLKYHQTNDGRFLLYSVGWNGKDDGGQLGPFPHDEGDWVWQ